jgi:hypothetical protein
MMCREAGERLAIGLEMTATAKALVWATIPADWPEEKRRAAFYERFYGPAEAELQKKLKQNQRAGRSDERTPPP